MSLMNRTGNKRAHAATVPAGGVISGLHEQHAVLRGIIAEGQTGTGQRRQQIFDGLCELPAVHEAGEEMVLWPVSRESAGAQVADGSSDEESEGVPVLAELAKMDVAGKQFAAKLAELEKAVSDHVEYGEVDQFRVVHMLSVVTWDR